MKHLKKSFGILLAFAGHMLMGVVMFIIIGSGAVLVHLAADKLAALGISGGIHYGLVGIEYLLFGCDFVAIVVWAVMSTVKAIKELMED